MPDTPNTDMSPLAPQPDLHPFPKSDSVNSQLADRLEILIHRLRENPTWTAPALESLSPTLDELLALTENLSIGILPIKKKLAPNCNTWPETQASMMPRVKMKKTTKVDSPQYGGGKNSGQKSKSNPKAAPPSKPKPPSNNPSSNPVHPSNPVRLPPVYPFTFRHALDPLNPSYAVYPNPWLL